MKNFIAINDSTYGFLIAKKKFPAIQVRIKFDSYILANYVKIFIFSK